MPRIVFVDGLDTRRATIVCTGLEVWEVIATYRAVGEDFEKLGYSYPQLTASQIRATLAYYVCPEEIDARLARDERWTPEVVRSRNPFTRPGPFRAGSGTTSPISQR